MYNKSTFPINREAGLRSSHHPHLIAFRAGDRLAAAIYERARDSGVSVSEYLRTIARDRVGLS